jgi:DNA-directed RNA polymerase subunit beta'
MHDWVDIPNPDYGRDTVYGNKDKKILRTTVGRVIFNQIWPAAIGFVNFPVPKPKLGDLILNTYKTSGDTVTVEVLDQLKELGFSTAFQAGISIGIDDMIIPESKKEIVAESRRKITEVESQFNKGIITDGERYNKVVDIWTNATDRIAKEVFAKLDANEGKSEVNPVYIMMDSGARGNKQQVRQLCGARGLMAKPSGEIIERPILSSFREGLTVLEYFISTHGARKGLADTALKTADAGYLTRKLCDVAMDVIIAEEDCGARDGVWKKAIYEGDDEIVGLKERIVGRCSSDVVKNPLKPTEVIVGSGELITEEIAAKIDDVGIERVKIMSPLTSSAKHGIDAKSYGINPATNRIAKIGDSVGIIAAQSIGEPGTQLTMRTFHIGGVASGGFKTPEIRVRSAGLVRYRGLRLVQASEGGNIVLNKTGSIQVLDDEGRELETYNIVVGSFLHVGDGEKIAKGAVLAVWDPYNIPVLSEKGGSLLFKDMIPGVTVKRELDESSARRSPSTRATRSRPARSSRRPRARPPRPRTSRAGFRAWPSSSRPAGRRRPPRWPG